MDPLFWIAIAALFVLFLIALPGINRGRFPASSTPPPKRKVELDEDEDPIYCPSCGSCGEPGCCSPSKCLKVRCLYGESNIREYDDMLRELTEALEENEKLKKDMDILLLGVAGKV